MKSSRLITPIILLLLSSACIPFQQHPTPESPTAILPDIGDGGLISGEPCGPPCLWGIIPGVSTKDDAISILSQEEFFTDCTQGSVAITCSILTVNFKDNIVAVVHYAPSGVLISDLIAKYGPPDGWELICSQNEVGYMVCPPIWLELTYIDEHMTVFLERQQSEDAYVLTPSSMVDRIFYYSDYFVLEIYHSTWHGYGEYRNR